MICIAVVVSTPAPEDGLAKLTCQALATVWGLRPAGDQAISSQSMCAAETPISSATPQGWRGSGGRKVTKWFVDPAGHLRQDQRADFSEAEVRG